MVLYGISIRPIYIVFKSSREVEMETFEDGGDGEDIPASNHWLLPSVDVTLWHMRATMLHAPFFENTSKSSKNVYFIILLLLK